MRYQLEALTPEQVEEAARRIDPEGSLSIVLDEDFDLRGSVLGAWIYVLDEAARERGLLTEKYNRIRQVGTWTLTSGSGGTTDVDFRLTPIALTLEAVITTGVVDPTSVVPAEGIVLLDFGAQDEDVLVHQGRAEASAVDRSPHRVDLSHPHPRDRSSQGHGW